MTDMQKIFLLMLAIDSEETEKLIKPIQPIEPPYPIGKPKPK